MSNHFVDPSSWQTLVSDLLAMAKKNGASSAETSAHISDGFSVEVRLGETESIQYHRGQSMEISVYFGQRKGSASTNDLTPTALAETVQKACQIAQATQPDPCHGLAEPQYLAKQIPDLDLYHPWPISVEQALTVAKECEQAGREADKRISNSEGAALSTHQGFYIYANTHDFMGYYSGSTHSLSCSLLAEYQGNKERDYEFTTARDAKDLSSAQWVGHQAAQKTLARLGARKISTRQCPVLFASRTARSLIGHFLSAISGRNLYQQASFLLDSLGKMIFPTAIHMIEKPHLAKALSSTPFDHEGIATREQSLITAGILQHYLLGSYSARKLGLPPTGNSGGVHNLIVSPTAGSFAELLQQMGTGLIVTELMGQGVNIVTGDYSRGASGFWVENGEIQHPVHEITIAGNLRDMFKQILAIGNELDWRGSIITGPTLIENMTIAGE